MKRRGRSNALRTRLALVILGLALGFAARWIGGLMEDKVKEPHFKPLPAETVDVQQSGDG